MIINAAKSCPKFISCNSGFCPIEMSGMHLKGESICKLFRLISRGESHKVPKEIQQAIIENQEIFLGKEFKGYMSYYRYIKKCL